MHLLSYAIAGTFVLAGAAIWSVGRDYRRQEQLSTRSVVLVWALYLLHAAVVIWAALTTAWPISIPLSVAVAVGLVLAVTGVGLLSFAIWQFHSLQRMSGTQTDQLITGGIYRCSRNPQNLGWGLTLLGVAIWGRSQLALALVAAFALLVQSYIVRLEEPYLERIYGEQYRAYRAQTGRYLSRPQGSGE